jgi:hypothetical protein
VFAILLFLYTNLIRLAVVILTIVSSCRRSGKKLIPAILALALSFLPWGLSLIDLQMHAITAILYQTVIFLSVFLGSGYRFYDHFAWWDKVVHFLSGIFFFGFGVVLAQKLLNTGLFGTLLFGFALSLALHELWEIIEFLLDSLFHTDHQHWQKHSMVVNHQPTNAIQPPGLVDTMSDSIFCLLGTIAAFIGWWIYLRSFL